MIDRLILAPSFSTVGRASAAQLIRDTAHPQPRAQDFPAASRTASAGSRIATLLTPLLARHDGSSVGSAPRWKACATCVAAISTLYLISAAPAHADLRLCNTTKGRIGVAIGYKEPAPEGDKKEAWATEGWWNIAAQTCETVYKGQLFGRFYYVHAIDYDRGGEWAGTSFMCTVDKTFTIKGVQDCQKRGFSRTGFFEVDTGDAKDWTIRLTDPGDGKK